MVAPCRRGRPTAPGSPSPSCARRSPRPRLYSAEPRSSQCPSTTMEAFGKSLKIAFSASASRSAPRAHPPGCRSCRSRNIGILHVRRQPIRQRQPSARESASAAVAAAAPRHSRSPWRFCRSRSAWRSGCTWWNCSENRAASVACTVPTTRIDGNVGVARHRPA